MGALSITDSDAAAYRTATRRLQASKLDEQRRIGLT
jgi:hypothetical protein